MELLIIGGIVAVAAVLSVVHLARTLGRDEPPCSACHSCSLPESARDTCSDATETAVKEQPDK